MASWLGTLSTMGEDTIAQAELWGIGHKRPRDVVGMFWRRDWTEYEYARDMLRLAGFDPFGKRPKFETDGRKSAKPEKKVKKQTKKKAVRSCTT